MGILRKILYALIGVLVVIVAAGGAYLALNGNHLGQNHAKSQQTAKTQQPADQSNNKQAQNQQASDPNQNTTGTDQQMQMNGTDGQQTQNSGTTAQQSQPDAAGQQQQIPGLGGQQQQTPGAAGQQPVPYPAAPQVRVINPDPYYDRLNKAQEIISDANKMITVDPFADSGKDPANNSTDMSKLHQGIYKMSEGMTIMQDTLDTLNKDIKGAAGFSPNPYQQGYPYQGYYQQPQQYGYNQQSQPYGYNSQYPYNQVPGTNYQQPPNQTQPNNQTNANQSGSQQNYQVPGNQAAAHSATPTNLLGNFSLQKTVTYVAYGILAASIAGVFIAILGMVNSMFKKPNSSSQS